MWSPNQEGKEEPAIDDSIFVFSFSNLRDRFGLTDQGEEENPLHFHAGTNEAGSLLPPPLFLFALSEKRRRRREGQIWEWGRVDDDLFLSNGEGEKGVGIKWWEGMKKDWAPFISFSFFL